MLTDDAIEDAMEWPRGTMKNIDAFDMAYRVRKVADAAWAAAMARFGSDGYRTSLDGLTRTKIAPDAAAPMVPTPKVMVRIGSTAVTHGVAPTQAQSYKRVGAFSIAQDGGLCFHKGTTDLKSLCDTLDEGVTGGPYRAVFAYMASGVKDSQNG